MQTSEDMTQIEYIRNRASMYLGRLGNGNSPADGICLMLQDAVSFVRND